MLDSGRPDALVSRQAESDQTEAKHKGNPKMFPTIEGSDNLTPWQRFENLASRVFAVKKSDIDAHKPVRSRKSKRA